MNRIDSKNKTKQSKMIRTFTCSDFLKNFRIDFGMT